MIRESHIEAMKARVQIDLKKTKITINNEDKAAMELRQRILGDVNDYTY